MEGDGRREGAGLSLLIREGGLGRGGASAHVLGRGKGREILAEDGDTGMGTEANSGRGTETDLRMGSETQEWSRDGGKDGAERHWDGTEKGRKKGAGQRPQDKGKNHVKRD